MFTGLIQGLGQILSIQDLSGQRRFRIKPLFAFNDIRDGESVAVNGACLSVETHEAGQFAAYASAETLSKTTLGGLRKNDKVNLERALRLGDRFGGHIVSGHVDCVATVLDISGSGESIGCSIGFPQEFGAQVVARGSIALDGISLTINRCGGDTLEVNIIPDSRKRTTIPFWRKGTRINMETDLIGKYVLRCARLWRASGQDKAQIAPGSALNTDFLAKHGFL